MQVQCVLILLAVITRKTNGYGQVIERHVSGVSGESVRLPCSVDETRCGRVHNIQWYRGHGDTRVYIFSELAGVELDENALMGRGFFHYDKNTSITQLEISPLLPSDESVYKCELTYLDIRDSCSVIQFVNLTTLAKPDTIAILLGDGSQVSSGSVLGPLNEQDSLLLRCEAAGGKPSTQVTWWKDTVNIGGEQSSVSQSDGTALGTNILHHRLSRADLGATLECQAVSGVSDLPLRASISIDLHVRPLSVSVSGVSGSLLEGRAVTFTCRIVGARPAANATWYLAGETPENTPSSRVIAQADGTFETVSEFDWKAERSLSGREVMCVASNSVTAASNSPPLSDQLSLDILYPPYVTVSPSDVTVNETMDILLFCSFDANPAELLHVQWLKDGVPLDTSHEAKFSGATVQQPSLFIKNASGGDSGFYGCQVDNSVGKSGAQSYANVRVIRAPVVHLEITPDRVFEADQSNVTIRCLVARDSQEDSGGDSWQLPLKRVRWYIGDNIIKETVSCTDLADESSDLCSRTADQLTLSAVDRSLHARYSCRALSEAGWGRQSPSHQLTVYYPPSNASIQYEPAIVLKGAPLVLKCDLKNSGYPPAKKFTWMRGSQVVADAVTDTWHVPVASLDFNTNISCVARNSAGSSGETQTSLKVRVGPEFIEPLPRVIGALFNSTHAEVTCRVECSPICTINWLKNKQPIYTGRFYTIKARHLAADAATNRLQSVVSTLQWNLQQWPPEALMSDVDSSNYSCVGSANLVGPAVSSSAEFVVQYPPRQVLVSPSSARVVEGDTQISLKCTSNAQPSAVYVWEHDGQVIATGDSLVLRPPGGVRRRHAGTYTCRASNQHGVSTTRVSVHVQYVPSCTVRQLEVSEGRVLRCEADAAPANVTFSWLAGNQSLNHLRREYLVRATDRHLTAQQTPASEIVLPSSGANMHSVQCVASNTLGSGAPCFIELSDVRGWMWVLSEGDSTVWTLLTVAVITVFAIASVVTYLWCRKNHTHEKYIDRNSPKDIDRSEPSNDSGTEANSLQSNMNSNASMSERGGRDTHRWPNRPGVHVHANTSLATMTGADSSSGNMRQTLVDSGANSAGKFDGTSATMRTTQLDRNVYENLTFHTLKSSNDQFEQCQLKSMRPVECVYGLQSTQQSVPAVTPQQQQQQQQQQQHNQHVASCNSASSSAPASSATTTSAAKSTKQAESAAPVDGASSPSELSWTGSSGYGSAPYWHKNDSSAVGRDNVVLNGPRSKQCSDLSACDPAQVENTIGFDGAVGIASDDVTEMERGSSGGGLRRLVGGAEVDQLPSNHHQPLDPAAGDRTPGDCRLEVRAKTPPLPTRRGAEFKPPYYNLSLPHPGTARARRTCIATEQKLVGLSSGQSRKTMGVTSTHVDDVTQNNGDLRSHNEVQISDGGTTSTMSCHSNCSLGTYNSTQHRPSAGVSASQHDQLLQRRRLLDTRRFYGPEPGRRRPAQTMRSSSQSRAATSSLLRGNSQSRVGIPSLVRSCSQSRESTLSPSHSNSQLQRRPYDVSAGRSPITINELSARRLVKYPTAEYCREQSQVHKQYVPNQYAVLQLSGISQEIDV